MDYVNRLLGRSFNPTSRRESSPCNRSSDTLIFIPTTRLPNLYAFEVCYQRRISRIYINQARMNNESLNNDNIKSYELLNNTGRWVISVIINDLIIIKIQMISGVSCIEVRLCKCVMLPTIYSNTISSYLMHICAYNSFYITYLNIRNIILLESKRSIFIS